MRVNELNVFGKLYANKQANLHKLDAYFFIN